MPISLALERAPPQREMTAVRRKQYRGLQAGGRPSHPARPGSARAREKKVTRDQSRFIFIARAEATYARTHRQLSSGARWNGRPLRVPSSPCSVSFIPQRSRWLFPVFRCRDPLYPGSLWREEAGEGGGWLQFARPFLMEQREDPTRVIPGRRRRCWIPYTLPGADGRVSLRSRRARARVRLRRKTRARSRGFSA